MMAPDIGPPRHRRVDLVGVVQMSREERIMLRAGLAQRGEIMARWVFSCLEVEILLNSSSGHVRRRARTPASGSSTKESERRIRPLRIPEPLLHWLAWLDQVAHCSRWVFVKSQLYAHWEYPNIRSLDDKFDGSHNFPGRALEAMAIPTLQPPDTRLDPHDTGWKVQRPRTVRRCLPEYRGVSRHAPVKRLVFR